ncbi:CaiB/BaiF CoA transferase family protein [Azospirillum sp. CT11-132]|uniref:CaiB/BaiF CoA transferase family protein n=1 Tax=unclassified Azospirillum TaxID=2630922 RepID=UPI000D605B8C|nr:MULTISPECIES: CoA transferase [unclassified Azospirillum]PWC59273.1 acetyl-CoA acetyltransferase [Azospirillum sp. TSH7]PWC60066.1 acetyl-CoA acetyltransferase [Azospirillum sp. TSH20]
MNGPLNGVRILDLTSVLVGPYATQILGDLGADVLKVESPAGDNVRGIGPMRHPGMGAIFLHANRSKRSIVLDLKAPDGRQALLDLARNADVLIHNVRPRAMARLGLSYDDLAAVNPSIIYAAVTGFGQDGPYAEKPAYDDLIQGAAAIPTLIADSSGGDPRYVPATMADRTVGLHAVYAVAAALFHRERTGEGQEIEIPMFEAMTEFVLGDHMGGMTFEPPLGPTGYPRLLARHRRPYRTSDGHICVVIYNDKQWRNFFTLIGREGELDSDPRFADIGSRTRHINELYGLVADAIATRSTADWLADLTKADIPVMPLHTPDSLIDDSHHAATGFLRTVEHPHEGTVRSIGVPTRWSGRRPEPVRQAPRLGEHSVELLREAGYDEERIADLLARGITRSPAAVSPSPAATAAEG